MSHCKDGLPSLSDLRAPQRYDLARAATTTSPPAGPSSRFAENPMLNDRETLNRVPWERAQDAWPLWVRQRLERLRARATAGGIAAREKRRSRRAAALGVEVSELADIERMQAARRWRDGCRRGGCSRSGAKATAARANGRLGGRPRKCQALQDSVDQGVAAGRTTGCAAPEHAPGDPLGMDCIARSPQPEHGHSGPAIPDAHSPPASPLNAA